VTAWTTERGLGLDGLVPVAQMAALARRWYKDRLSPDWAPKTREASQAIFTAVGLTGPFWTLPGA
jgi:hypothetical protein